MKKMIGAGLVSAILASIVFAGCFSLIDPKPSAKKNPAGMRGQIYLSIAGFRPASQARTVFPDNIDSFTYTVTFTAAGETPVSKNFSGDHTETLKAGYWNIVVEAKFGGNVVGRDTASNVEVKEAQTTVVNLYIRPVTDMGAPNGTLTWSIKYPVSLVNEAVVEYGGISLDPLNPGDITAYGINAGVAGTRSAVASLPPGSYTFRTVLKNLTSGKFAGNIDAVHIYPGLNATLDWEFVEESFKNIKICQGSIELYNPSEVSIVSAVLKSTDGNMLSDAPLIHSVNNTWNFEITALEDAVSLNNLYIEILTAANGSEALSHNFGTVSLSNITLMPVYMYALQAAAGANGKININSSAPAASIQRDFLYGDGVVLTAVPDSGYECNVFTGLPSDAVVSGNTATFNIIAVTAAMVTFKQSVTGPAVLIHHWPLENDTDVIGGKNLSRPDQNWVAYGSNAEWERNVLWIGEWGAATPCLVENFNQSGRMTGLTVSFWIKPDDLDSTAAGRQLQNFLSLGTGNAGLYNLSYFGGRIGLGNAAPPDDQGSGSTGAVFGNITAADYNGKWTHLALTMENGRAVLYINGVKFGNEVIGTVSLYDWVNWPATVVAVEPPQIDSLWIGGTVAHTKYMGLMSDIRLYNGVLSSGEIAALANELTALIHHWPLNGNTLDITGGKNASLNSGVAGFTNDSSWGRDVLEIKKAAGNNSANYNACYVPGFNAGAQLTAMTASLWIKPADLTVGVVQNFLQFQMDNGINRGIDMLSYQNGKIGLGNGVAEFGNFPAATYNGKWTHLALTMESGRAVLYVNGTYLGELNGSVPLYDWWGGPGDTQQIPIQGPTIDTFWIGGQVAEQQFNGKIANVKLYNGLLGAGKIAALAGEVVDDGSGYGGGDGITHNDYDTSFLWGAASTSRPNVSLFAQWSSGNINIVVGNLSYYAGSSVWIDYKITDIFNKTVKSGSIEYLKSGGDQQQKSFAIDTTKLGHYTVTVTVDGRNLLGSRAGSRPAGFITYAVVADPSQRRPKVPYGPGVDKYIYFGMAFFPASPDPGYYDGLNLVDYMGVDASITGDLSWRSNVYGSGAGTRTNTALIESNNGNMITRPIYEMIEMTPYFPADFRTAYGASGLYGGELNALGEQELVAYVKSLAKVHIDKAGWRPHHYYQVLWEPVDWWWGWAGNDASLIRVYELAYPAIHQVYDDYAAYTGNPAWRTVPVVLGPTNSDATNVSWHQRLFNAGLANYIDGLSIHPYDPQENGLAGGTGSTGNGNDLTIANSIRDIMTLVRNSYAGRWNPRYHTDPFFWGTEQGMMDDTGGPIFQAQVLSRYNLIMMGEGFDANHMFKFSDNDENRERYGFFYNQTAMTDDWQRFAPTTISPKQAASAFAATSWLLKGYKGAGRIPGLSGTNFGYKYTDTESGDVIYAVWNYTGATSSVTINTGGSYKVYDIVGNETISGYGSVTLTTNGYVQYVKVY